MKRDQQVGGRDRGGLLAYLEVVFAAMAAATTGVLYAGFFTGRAYLLPVLTAAAGAAAVAILTAARRWRAATTLPAAVLGLAILAVAMVYRDTLDHGIPTVRTAPELGDGLLRGWARMLTTALPADVTPDLLITPVLLSWAASFGSTTIALRTRVILAPAVPTLLALVIGLLFTAGRPAAGGPVTAAYLLATLLLIVVRVARLDFTHGRASAAAADLPPPIDPPKRRLAGRLAFGVPIALIVTAAGIGGARAVPVAAGTDRFDPRTVAPQRYEVEDTLTPLVGIKSQLREEPSRTLFTVTVLGGQQGSLDRVRTAALDQFDGALWTSSDSFLVAGRTLPADPNLRHPRRITTRIDVRDLTGPYLPIVGWPVRIDATGLGFSARSGVLVTHRATSLRGLNYDLVSELAVRDSGLAGTVPDLGGEARHDTQLPGGLPPELAAKAAELAAKASTPYAKLTAIETYLRKAPYSLDARPGHSYDALRRLFSSNPQDRMGYAEQYAAAFAVLARSQGFPTRVAVGYQLRREALHGDTYQVTTADAHAWPEVKLAGYGWVSFEPTDFTRRVTTTQPQPQPEAGAVDQPADTEHPGTQPVVDPRLTSGPSARDRLITGTIIAAGGTVALLILGLLGVVLEKLRRRIRRRLGTANDRIIGAWRETTDRLIEHGLPVPRSLTAAEAATHATERFGEPGRTVAALAPLVSAAVFDPVEPDPDLAREAWELAGQFRRELRRARGWLRAIRAWFDPRPILHGWRDRRRLRVALTRMQGG